MLNFKAEKINIYYVCDTIYRTMVGFGPKQRCMGVSAKNQQVTNPKNTVGGFNHLVGRRFSDPFVQEEIKRFPFEVIQQPEDGIGIKVCESEFWRGKICIY